MKTEHLKKLVERMKQENKEWEVQVENSEKGFKVVTTFDSKNHSLENVLHKIALDIMTNLHYNFEQPIKIYVKEKE